MKSLVLMILLSIQITLFGQNKDGFENGYYYDLQNNKISGLIYYEYSYKKNFQFKTDKDSKKIKVDISDCKGFVIEKDSFAIIRNFSFEGVGGGLNPSSIGFAQVIETGKINLYKHYSSQGSGGPSLTESPFDLVNFIIKKEGEEKFITIRKRNKKKFKLQISEIIKDQKIVDKVNNEVYQWENMAELVKEYNSIN